MDDFFLLFFTFFLVFCLLFTFFDTIGFPLFFSFFFSLVLLDILACPDARLKLPPSMRRILFLSISSSHVEWYAPALFMHSSCYPFI